MTKLKLDKIHAAISVELEELSTMFKPHMKLTFIARAPNNDKEVIIVTDDDLMALSKVVEKYDEYEKSLK